MLLETCPGHKIDWLYRSAYLSGMTVVATAVGNGSMFQWAWLSLLISIPLMVIMASDVTKDNSKYNCKQPEFNQYFFFFMMIFITAKCFLSNWTWCEVKIGKKMELNECMLCSRDGWNIKRGYAIFGDGFSATTYISCFFSTLLIDVLPYQCQISAFQTETI